MHQLNHFRRPDCRNLNHGPGSSIFVGGLPMGATHGDLFSHFSNFGDVTGIDIPLNNKGERKGFAFVHFQNPEAVHYALLLKIHDFKGKKIAVRRSIDTKIASIVTKSMQERKIFAQGFPTGTTEDKVNRWAQSFGEVTRVLSPRGGIGKRAFCYIIMAHKDDFNRMIEAQTLNYLGHKISLVAATLKSTLSKEAEKDKKNVLKVSQSSTDEPSPEFYSPPFGDQGPLEEYKSCARSQQTASNGSRRGSGSSEEKMTLHRGAALQGISEERLEVSVSLSFYESLKQKNQSKIMHSADPLNYMIRQRTTPYIPLKGSTSSKGRLSVAVSPLKSTLQGGDSHFSKLRASKLSQQLTRPTPFNKWNLF